MAYLFLVIALACLSVKGYCGKKTSTDIKTSTDPLLFNLLRMLLCIVIGFVMILIDGATTQMSVEPLMLWITAGAGAANAAFLICWILAVRRIPLVTMDVSLTIGSILPAVLCLILFNVPISPYKMIGFGMILLATLVLSGYGKSVGRRPGVLGVLLAVIATLGEGLSSFCQQLYKQYFTAEGGVTYENSVYQFYTYVFAAAILLLVFLGLAIYGYRKKEKEPKSQYVRGLFASCKHPFPYIVVMAICMFAANYLQTAATTVYGMTSQELYPVIKGGCLVTVNLTAMLFFNEKPTWRSITGSVIALGGSVAILC
jgi:drug/metabolite transporter (DMT)-like permease